jgi:hypothetical protein
MLLDVSVAAPRHGINLAQYAVSLGKKIKNHPVGMNILLIDTGVSWR